MMLGSEICLKYSAIEKLDLIFFEILKRQPNTILIELAF